MALTLRLSAPDDSALKALAERTGLLPIDLVRATVRGLLVASKANGGKVELPIHVRTKAEEEKWQQVVSTAERVARAAQNSTDGQARIFKSMGLEATGLLEDIVQYATCASLRTPSKSITLKADDVEGARIEVYDVPTAKP